MTLPETRRADWLCLVTKAFTRIGGTMPFSVRCLIALLYGSGRPARTMVSQSASPSELSASVHR